MLALRSFVSGIASGSYLCPLKPGLKCSVNHIVRLSESSECHGCPYVYHSQYDELLARRISPSTNPTTAGTPRPAANLGGSL